MMRRQLIVLFAAAAASQPVITLGQVSAQRPLIAVLLGGSQAVSQHNRNALTQGLQELGYVEGRDYDIEFRYADRCACKLPTGGGLCGQDLERCQACRSPVRAADEIWINLKAAKALGLTIPESFLLRADEVIE